MWGSWFGTIPQISKHRVLGLYPLKLIQSTADVTSGRKPVDWSNINIVTKLTCRCSILYTARTIINDHITSQLEIENKINIVILRTKYILILRTVLTADISQVGSCYCLVWCRLTVCDLV